MTQIPQFLIGLDLGQAQDPSALVVLERVTGTEEVEREIIERGMKLTQRVHVPTPTEYHARHLERFPLGTTYPNVVRRVAELLAMPALNGRPHVEEWKAVGIDGAPLPSIKRTLPGGPALIVDATGVGRPVVDVMNAQKLNPIAVTIHGGDSVTYDRGWRVPKRDLVGAMAVLLQTGRFKVANALPLAAVLTQELLRFRVKIDPLTAHDSYGAWREGDHDDIVLACAVACWWAERQAGRTPTSIPSTTTQYVIPC